MREIASMALNEDLAECIRVVLAGTGSLREVRMFGGLCWRLPDMRIVPVELAAQSKTKADPDI
jgi:hypothetical protein